MEHLLHIVDVQKINQSHFGLSVYVLPDLMHLVYCMTEDHVSFQGRSFSFVVFVVLRCCNAFLATYLGICECNVCLWILLSGST